MCIKLVTDIKFTDEIFDQCSLALSSPWERHGKKSLLFGKIWSQMCDKDRLSIVFSVYVTAVGSLWAIVHCSLVCHKNCRLLGEVLSLTTMSTVLYGVYSDQMSVGWYRTTHSPHHNFDLCCKMAKQTGAWICVTVAHMLLLFWISKTDSKIAISLE